MMDGDKYVNAREETVDCICSLLKAMEKAGGANLESSDIRRMTLMDFITTIASQNGIRFHYDPPSARREELDERPGL